MNATVTRGLERLAEVRGAQACDSARAAIAARANEFGVSASIEGDGVRLTAPGLVARAFGSRRCAADPRMAALIAGEQP